MKVRNLKEINGFFGCLKRYCKWKILIDLHYPNHYIPKIGNYDNWKEFYPEEEELFQMNPNTLKYLGPPMKIMFLKI